MRKRWRKLLLVILDPRPRWWASLWAWGLVTFALFVLWDGVRPCPHGGSGFQWPVFMDSSGACTWEDPGVAGATQLSVCAVYQVWRGPGYLRYEFEPPKVTLARLRPVSPKTVQQVSRWVGADLAQNASNEELRRGFTLWRDGRTIGVWRTWWRWPLEGVPYFGFALLGAIPVVWFLRGSQAAWFARQIKRLDAGLCPSCAYDLTGAPSGVCPECGTDSATARTEAESALGVRANPKPAAS